MQVTEEEDNYSSNHFLMDLTDAFDLPNYFSDDSLIRDMEALDLLKIDRERDTST